MKTGNYMPATVAFTGYSKPNKVSQTSAYFFLYGNHLTSVYSSVINMSFLRSKYPRSVVNFVVLYFDNCCIHGFRYLVQSMLLVFER